jgi:hypothetical protein
MGLRQWQAVYLDGRQASTPPSYWEEDQRKYATDVIDCNEVASYK